MNIIGTQYTANHKSLDIYIAGCSGSPKCKGCHNPESWNFNQGKIYYDWFENIKKKINDFDTLIDNIMIFGGEPLDQEYYELTKFLMFLNQFEKKIWLFTRYSLNEVPYIIKMFCDYIKTERYIEGLRCDDNVQHGIQLATSNQKINKKGVDY